MMNTSIKVIGVAGVQAKLRAASRQRSPACIQAVNDTLRAVFDESQKLVPRRTGALASSGQITPASDQGQYVAGQIVYSSPYALYVHENLAMSHKPPTQSKFLEAAMLHHENDLKDNLAHRIRTILGTAGL